VILEVHLGRKIMREEEIPDLLVMCVSLVVLLVESTYYLIPEGLLKGR
jgi:hypothetical protein